MAASQYDEIKRELRGNIKQTSERLNRLLQDTASVKVTNAHKASEALKLLAETLQIIEKLENPTPQG